MDISVIIPAYNAEKTIAEQIRSLSLQETNAQWELIISDNGSTDDTRKVAESFAKDFPVPLRVIDSSNQQGVSNARNKGVEASEATVVAFCDADDRTGPYWVESIWQTILAGADAVGGNIIVLIDNQPQEISPDSGVRKSSWGESVTGCNMAFRRAIFNELGGFDTSLPPYGNEDIEFCLRLSQRGAAFAKAEKMDIYFTPTVDRSKLLKKVYNSAKSEVVIWHNHSDVFGKAYTPLSNLKNLVTLPARALKQKYGPNKLVRELVLIYGRTEQSIRYTINGWPTPSYKK